jgi:cytochrome c-type biogenesis protein CcmH/NrfG
MIHALDDPEGAEVLFRQAISAGVKSADVYNGLAGALHEQGTAANFEEMAQASKEALKLDPQHDAAWFNLAIAMREKGDLMESIAALERLCALHPHDLEAQKLLRQSKAVSQSTSPDFFDPDLPDMHEEDMSCLVRLCRR